jgi:pilus assembly protein CpaC
MKPGGCVNFLKIKLNMRNLYKFSLLIFLFLSFQDIALSITKNMTLEQNTADIIQLPPGTSELFVANPEVADIQMNSPEVAYIFGKKPGITTIFSASGNGKASIKVNLTIVHNITRLKEIIKSVAPNEPIELISTPAGIILNGTVTSAALVKNIRSVVERFLGGKEVILNNLQISSPTQVYLKVKVAEVSRKAMNKLNINWASNFSSNNYNFGVLMGRPTLSAGGGFIQDVATNSLGVQFNDGTTNLSTLIDALNTEGLGTILAEPNLIALSGETASFLVGGEFPYPVPQDNNVTIQFKQFGISLAFTPTVLGSNRINLRVRPEVSELDPTKSLTIALGGAGGSATIPSIQTRRAETSVELASGQGMMIAGLFTTSTKNSINEFPGLADIPILGALFRSNQFQRDETELVILVTPYLVNPVSQESLSLPTDGLHHSSQLDMILTGRLNKNPQSNDFKQPDAKLMGVAGFHVE